MLRGGCITLLSAIFNKVNGEIVHVKISHHPLILLILGLREIKIHNVFLLFLGKSGIFFPLSCCKEPIFEGVN